jgi:hypothetical protein
MTAFCALQLGLLQPRVYLQQRKEHEDGECAVGEQEKERSKKNQQNSTQKMQLTWLPSHLPHVIHENTTEPRMALLSSAL